MVGKEDLKGDVKRLIVPFVLDQGRSERRLESGTIGEIDDLNGFHRVDRFDHRHRDTGRPEFLDEVGEELDHQ